jgi:hypothetical protein
MQHEATHWAQFFPLDGEIPFILAAVLRCSASLRKKHDTEYENKVSNRLRKLLVQDVQLRQRPIMVDREAYVYDDDQEEPVGRLDFRFLYTREMTYPLPYFAIEAKRLHVALPSRWDSGVPAYVTGNQGMMCFIEQRYARGLTSAGMLGYVFDGDVEKARGSVATLIEANREKLRTAPPFKLVVSAVLPGDTRVSETIHALGHGDFVIYHLFIAV